MNTVIHMYIPYSTGINVAHVLITIPSIMILIDTVHKHIISLLSHHNTFTV